MLENLYTNIGKKPESDVKSFLCDLIQYHIKAKEYEMNYITKNEPHY